MESRNILEDAKDSAHGRTPRIPRQRELDVGGVQPPTRPSSAPWMGQNTQRRLESENKRGAYECICISERQRQGPTRFNNQI
ncbi:hypothetical protein [Acidithrix ferrooxidans]|uniref:hypothetical protein n=1 Tax=Acidithrix ferrooxidans TaxID=1280514 RepID=UPI001269DD7A|nr:hypothetical protein [Acidithrix ferrooxidans]